MGLRCFIALDVESRMRDACEIAQERLSKYDERLRGEKWVARQNLHITLAFIGDIQADRTGELIDGLSPMIDGSGPIVLSRPRVRARPSGVRATMIWTEFEDTDGAFATVAAGLARAGQAYSHPTGGRPRSPHDRRMPVPHLTLCRFRRARSLDPAALDLSQQAFLGLESPMSYPRATLYASRLAPQGPTYSELFVWHMRGE